MRSLILYTVPAIIVWISVYALPNPTPEELIERENRQAIMDCLDTLSGTSLEIQKGTIECSKIPFRSITWTGQLTPASEPPSIETVKLNDCMSKYNHKKVCTEYAQWLRTSNIKFEIETEELWKLHEKVCKKQINSPLCKDRALFDRLYHLTEERLPNKQFFPILLGITNAESSLGLNFAKDKVWGTCTGRNNWWWIKWKINDDGSRQKDQAIPDKYGCYLYQFDSIESYWISKINTFRYGYKWCIDHKTPVWCISWAYVWDRNVHEQSWIRNVSIFLD